MKTRPSTSLVVIGVLLFSLLPAPRAAAWSFFTNQADFTNATASAGSFTEFFDELDGDDWVPSPNTFTDGVTPMFDAASTKGTGPENLFCLVAPNSEHWLQVSDPDYSLVFTNFRPGTSAIGGNFFTTDNNGYGEFAAEPVTLTAHLTDSTVISTNVSPVSPGSFFGFVFDSNIRFLVISAPPGFYPTARSVDIGFNATNTDPVITVGNGKLFYSFVAGTNATPVVVTTTNLTLTNSWTTNGVTALPPIPLTIELTRYRFETPTGGGTQRFLRVMP